MYILAMSKAGGTIGMLLWIIVLFGSCISSWLVHRNRSRREKKQCVQI